MSRGQKSRTILDRPEQPKEKADPEDSGLGLVIDFDDCVDEFCEPAKILTFRPKLQPPAP